MRNLIGTSLSLIVSLMFACSSSDPSAGDPSADPPGDNADTASDITSQMVGRWGTASYYQSMSKPDGYPPPPFTLGSNTQVALESTHLDALGTKGKCSDHSGDGNWGTDPDGSGLCTCEPALGQPGCPSSCNQLGTWQISGVKQTNGYYQGTLKLAMEPSYFCAVLPPGKTSTWAFDFDPHPSYNSAPTLKLYNVNDSVHGGDGHEWDYERVGDQ
jgi:hypothetical protein